MFVSGGQGKAEIPGPAAPGPHDAQKPGDIGNQFRRRPADQSPLEMFPRQAVILLEIEGQGQFQAHTHQIRLPDEDGPEGRDRQVQERDASLVLEPGILGPPAGGQAQEKPYVRQVRPVLQGQGFQDLQGFGKTVALNQRPRNSHEPVGGQVRLPRLFPPDKGGRGVAFRLGPGTRGEGGRLLKRRGRTIISQSFAVPTRFRRRLSTPSPLALFTPSPLALFTPSPLALFTPSPLALFTPSPLALFTPSPLEGEGWGEGEGPGVREDAAPASSAAATAGAEESRGTRISAKRRVSITGQKKEGQPRRLPFFE